MTTAPTLAFGEALWDLLPQGAALGGAPLNFAHRLAALGTPAIPVSRLGRDDLGERARRAVAGLGLRTDLIQRDDHLPTGTVRVTLDADRQPDYLIVPGVAYDAIEWTPELAALAGGAACVCFGTLAQRAPASRQTLARLLDAAPRALKFCDINLRRGCYGAETVRSSIERADALKLNEQELATVRELMGLPPAGLAELAARLRRVGALRYVLVTLGDRGALAVGPDDEIVYAPGRPVRLVDPLGAGDAFAAGFVHALLGGSGLRAACELGVALGALTAARAGATAAIAPGEVQRMLRLDGGRVIEPELTAYL